MRAGVDKAYARAHQQQCQQIFERYKLLVQEYSGKQHAEHGNAEAVNGNFSDGVVL